MQDLLKLLTDEIIDFHEGVREVAINPKGSVEEIRRHLEEVYGDFAQSLSPQDLFVDVARMMRHWNLHVTHPRYFGLFNPSVQPASVVGDALVAAYNPQLAAWSHAPAANEIERHTTRYFASRLGLNLDQCASCFTTGGAEANQSAVLAALTDRLPEYARKGLMGVAEAPVVYLSGESHHSFEKIVHHAGLGRDGIRHVPVDGALRLDVAALGEAVQADREAGCLPLMVVATAGSTGAGVVDPLPQLADFCTREGLWFHVDAAWGGAACLSPRLRPFLKGIERADSVTWDAHKWLSVPMGAGMFFCTRPEAVRQTFEVATPYMPDRTSDTVDPYLSTIQWSRRHIGLKVFMSLAALGERGYCEAIEHQAAMGDRLREELTHRGWRLVNHTAFPVVCFTHPAIEEGTIPLAEVIQRLLVGNFWVSEVRLTGHPPVIRACITSYRTQPQDVVALAEAATEIVSG